METQCAVKSIKMMDANNNKIEQNTRTITNPRRKNTPHQKTRQNANELQLEQRRKDRSARQRKERERRKHLSMEHTRRTLQALTLALMLHLPPTTIDENITTTDIQRIINITRNITEAQDGVQMDTYNIVDITGLDENDAKEDQIQEAISEMERKTEDQIEDMYETLLQHGSEIGRQQNMLTGKTTTKA